MRLHRGRPLREREEKRLQVLVAAGEGLERVRRGQGSASEAIDRPSDAYLRDADWGAQRAQAGTTVARLSLFNAPEPSTRATAMHDTESKGVPDRPDLGPPLFER